MKEHEVYKTFNMLKAFYPASVFEYPDIATYRSWQSLIKAQMILVT